MKNNKIKYFIIVAFCVIAIYSCEEIVDRPIPDAAPKLVIQSYISPQDTQIIVYVTKSVPVIGSNWSDIYENNAVDDANVVISDGSSNVSLSFDASNEYYVTDTTNFKIQAGVTYYLDVTAPGGFHVDASCTVPVAANNTIEVLPIDSTKVEGSNDMYSYYIQFQFHDTPNQTDFYRILLYRKSQFNTINKLFFEQGNELESDINKDGWIFYYRAYVCQSNGGLSNYDSYPLYLLTTDEHYYEYHSSVDRFSEGFFSEAALIYSNINNGLGVFAGYNQVVVNLKF